MIVHVRHGVRGDGPARRRARRADAGEARVPAPQQAVDGGLEVRERERQEFPEYARLRRARSGRPGHAVRAAIPPQERLVGQGGADDAELEPASDVGDATLHGSEEALDALLLVRFVLLGTGRELLPRFVRLPPRGVDVDDVLPRGAQGLVEYGRDEEGA